jgi:hypothetical protein
MGLILRVPKDIGVDVCLYLDLQSPPSLVKIYDACGRLVTVAAAWYDNALLCSSDANLADRLYRRFASVCGI